MEPDCGIFLEHQSHFLHIFYSYIKLCFLYAQHEFTILWLIINVFAYFFLLIILFQPLNLYTIILIEYQLYTIPHYGGEKYFTV